jgi:NTE family protein
MSEESSVMPPSKSRNHTFPWKGQGRSFELTTLLLQGGGALGSYQAGVYEALAEADLHPDWVAGISIGAVNAALIAGNPPERRVERLQEFWEAVSTPPLGVPYLKLFEINDDSTRRFVNQMRAFGILLFGAPHFFTPRLARPVFWPIGAHRRQRLPATRLPSH